MTRLQTIVTHLDMEAPLAIADSPVIWPEGVSFLREKNMALAEYRALYDAVGRQWHWVNRRHLTDKQLAALIHHPATDIFVLRDKGKAIGFVELNNRLFPQVEIVFVGLIDSVIGNQFGPMMMRHALQQIKSRDANRIIIQTCTLDHPAALKLYQKLGFTAYKRKQVEIIDE